MYLSLINLIVVVFIVIFGLVLSLWVFIADKKAISNQLLSFLVILAMVNLSFSYLMNFANAANWSLVFGKTAWVTVLIGVVVFYYFIDHFPSKAKTTFSLDSFFVLIIGLILSILTIFTPLIIKSVDVDNGVANIVSGPLMNVFYVVIVGILMLSFFTLIKKYLRSSQIEKTKIQLFLMGLSIFVFLSLIFNALLPAFFSIEKYSFIGDYSIIIFFGLTAYAIVKRRLFDVKLAIVRSVTYSLVLATLAGIYVIIAFAISTVFNSGQTSTGQIISGVAISLLLAFIFQPLRRFFDKITNRVFYKDNYNTDDFFAKLNKTLSTTTDLRGLLERVAYEIGTTLKAEQAFFFIYTNGDGHFISAGTDNHNHLPKHDAILVEQKSQGIDNIIAESSLNENDPIRRMMISHRIALILPLMQDDAVIGYLCLGDHLTSGYTNRDIKALNTISDELIIAIQNALAVHEIRELNDTLKQKIANATKELRSSNAILRRLDEIKDEFISMASHQLRTPLTSVKGYISMVIEGDAGKISPSQKQLLDQAFMSSENMVHLINDFLNVSRIQSGKFVIDKTLVDLSELVDEEMNGLRPNATARGMKLVYKKPRKFPTVEIDEGKFRQVVMNFADNAIYYSHENSSIIISLGVEGNDIVFTVKDTGIGVPKAEQDKLFAKFYRAANAKIQRPDGTGVGIYLAKKVIDAHDGKIIFDSVEGKGSTFGFRLPIK